MLKKLPTLAHILDWLMEHLLEPLVRGIDDVWRVIWDGLDTVTPHHIGSAFYIATGGVLVYLEATAQIVDGVNILVTWGIPSWFVLLSFGLAAWLIANVRRPLVTVLSLVPMVVYGIALLYGALSGQLALGGLLAAIFILTAFGFGVVALRNYYERQFTIEEARRVVEAQKSVLSTVQHSPAEKANDNR